MNEPSRKPHPVQRHGAIDINDFVYAATGDRVRRLTMPDGSHWFPAVDVCKRLGYTTPRKALLDHVPEDHRDNLETVTGSHCLSIPAGRSWRRDLQLIDLQGLILLVNACTKPACAPFKQWVAEVIETVQREGSYTLEEAEVQPAAPGSPIAYAMPEQVADAIVRLESHNLQVDEEIANAQRESLAVQKQMLAAQQATLAAQQVIAQAMQRIADRLDTPALERPARVTAAAGGTTTEAVLADWRRRLSVTEDVWAVAVVIAPVLVEEGELRRPLESIAARTGLPVRRVNECLRMLRKHACIRSRGAAKDGAPVYVLNRT
ncbi:MULTISPECIES: Bro-N domain-containing protein [unclassified Streptomyces]|uniref:BRO-N domain-containing protein n=1 Tax=unclassified Streptomyces TaxID=2593676 RepID=UPI0003A93BE6|nr:MULTISPECIES: Bro-N domain-containing protein [unclassified Streptomyces]EYT80086.1 DNA-binding protein [Streptomyces sp. Tu 6176]